MSTPLRLDHRTPADRPAEWRAHADFTAPVPDVEPLAAAWIEAVCDELMTVVLLIDGLHAGFAIMDPDRWTRAVIGTLSEWLWDRGLVEQGLTYGLDLTSGLLADAGMDVVLAASSDRAKTPATWENSLIGYVVWWRGLMYETAAGAEKG